MNPNPTNKKIGDKKMIKTIPRFSLLLATLLFVPLHAAEPPQGEPTHAAEAAAQKDTPLCNAWLTMLHGIGVEAERHGDSTGVLKEIVA